MPVAYCQLKIEVDATSTTKQYQHYDILILMVHFNTTASFRAALLALEYHHPTTVRSFIYSSDKMS